MLERETIYQRVWGYAMAHGDRSVDVFIRKLRQKLEKRSPSWGYIHTHFGSATASTRNRPGSSRRSCDRAPAEAAAPTAAEQPSQIVHNTFTAG